MLAGPSIGTTGGAICDRSGDGAIGASGAVFLTPLLPSGLGVLGTLANSNVDLSVNSLEVNPMLVPLAALTPYLQKTGFSIVNSVDDVSDIRKAYQSTVTSEFQPLPQELD